MRERFLGVIGCFFLTALEYKISGYIKDVYTNEAVKDVVVFCKNDQFTSNAEGYYELYLTLFYTVNTKSPKS